jgi:hypothetical protein
MPHQVLHKWGFAALLLALGDVQNAYSNIIQA